MSDQDSHRDDDTVRVTVIYNDERYEETDPMTKQIYGVKAYQHVESDKVIRVFNEDLAKAVGQGEAVQLVISGPVTGTEQRDIGTVRTRETKTGWADVVTADESIPRVQITMDPQSYNDTDMWSFLDDELSDDDNDSDGTYGDHYNVHGHSPGPVTTIASSAQSLSADEYVDETDGDPDRIIDKINELSVTVAVDDVVDGDIAQWVADDVDTTHMSDEETEQMIARLTALQQSSN